MDYKNLVDALADAYLRKEHFDIDVLQHLNKTWERTSGHWNFETGLYQVLRYFRKEGLLAGLLDRAAEMRNNQVNLLLRIRETKAAGFPEIDAPRRKVNDYLQALISNHYEQINRSLEFLVPAEANQNYADVARDKYRSLAVSDLINSGERFDSFMDAFQRKHAQSSAAHILLLGEPGAGKTYALSQVAVQLAKKRLKNRAAPVPLIARIVQWDSAKKSTLHSIAIQSASRILGDDETIIDFKDSSFVYLFDGLDELGSTGAQGISPQDRFLERVEAEFPRRTVVITCRIRDFNQLRNKRYFVAAFQLLPVSKDTIDERLKPIFADSAELQCKNPAVLRELSSPMMLNLFERFGAAKDIKQIDSERLFEQALLNGLDNDAKQALALLAQHMCLNYRFRAMVTLTLEECREILKELADDQIKDIKEQLAKRRCFFNDIYGRQTFYHARFRDHCAYAPLNQKLADGADDESRSGILLALGRMAESLNDRRQLEVVKTLSSHLDERWKPLIRRSAAFALGVAGQKLLATSELNPEIAKQFKQITIDVLKIGLNTRTDKAVRSNALWAFGRLCRIQPPGVASRPLRWLYHAWNFPWIKGRLMFRIFKESADAPQILWSLVYALGNGPWSAFEIKAYLNVPLRLSVRFPHPFTFKYRRLAPALIGLVSSSSSVRALVRALDDENRDVFWPSTWAIAELAQQEINALEYLGDADTEAKDQICRCKTSKVSDEERKLARQFCQQGIRSELTECNLELWKREDIRAALIRLLGSLTDNESADIFMEMKNDPSHLVNPLAVWSLTEIDVYLKENDRLPTVVEEVAGLLLNGKKNHPFLNRLALFALGRFKTRSPRVTEALKKMFSSTDCITLTAATWAAGTLGIRECKKNIANLQANLNAWSSATQREILQLVCKRALERLRE